MRATACDRILHQSRLRAWTPVFAGQQRQEPHSRPGALHTGFRGTPRVPEPRAVVRYWIGLRHTATELHRAPYRYLRYFSGVSSAVQLPTGTNLPSHRPGQAAAVLAGGEWRRHTGHAGTLGCERGAAPKATNRHSAGRTARMSHGIAETECTLQGLAFLHIPCNRCTGLPQMRRSGDVTKAAPLRVPSVYSISVTLPRRSVRIVPFDPR